MLAHTRYKHWVVGSEQIGVPGGGCMDQLGKWKTQNHLAPEVYVFRFCIYSRSLIHKDHKAPLHQFLEWMDGFRYGLCLHNVQSIHPFIYLYFCTSLSSVCNWIPHNGWKSCVNYQYSGNCVSISKYYLENHTKQQCINWIYRQWSLWQSIRHFGTALVQIYTVPFRLLRFESAINRKHIEENTSEKPIKKTSPITLLSDLLKATIQWSWLANCCLQPARFWLK